VIRNDESQIAHQVRRVFAQNAALLQRFHHQREIALFQIAHAAMHEFGGAAGGSLAEVVLFDERGAIAARRGVDGAAHAGGAAADDEQVPRLGAAQTVEHLGAVHAYLNSNASAKLAPSDCPSSSRYSMRTGRGGFSSPHGRSTGPPLLP